MNSHERVEAALSFRKPDRPPVVLHNFLMTAEDSGLDYATFMRDGKHLAEGHIRAWRRFGHDVILVDAGTHVAAEALGCQADYPIDNCPRVEKPALSSLDEVDILDLPDPRKTYPTNEILKAIQILSREIGDEVCILATADQGPFTLAAQLLGLQNFLFEAASRQRLGEMHRLLNLCAQFTISYAIALKEAGADMVRVGDSLSGTDVISPKLYREFAFPYQKRIATDLKNAGVVFSLHICGNATPIIGDMVSTGAAVLEIDEKTDLLTAKKAMEGRACLLGQVSPARMKFGNVAEVRRLTAETLETWMPSSGIIIGPGCTLPGDTPPENVEALIEVAKEHSYAK